MQWRFLKDNLITALQGTGKWGHRAQEDEQKDAERFPCAPSLDQTRARPSYDPVASSVPAPFQSSVVTSFAFSLALLKCFSTVARGAPPSASALRSQMRAVESPLLHARMHINRV